MKALVAFASKHGSTKEIADYIAKTLEQHQIQTDVLYVGAVMHLTDYDAVIIGSAVYAGQWRPEAAQFIKVRTDILAEKRIWLFSSGPTGHGNATDLLGGFLFPENLEYHRNKINPVDTAVFHGNLDLTKLTLAELMIVNSYGGPLGDYRQWDKIKAWADSIAATLAETQADSAATV
jgi:menaquinone-dependent protoporphyrinogen oxidase